MKKWIIICFVFLLTAYFNDCGASGILAITNLKTEGRTNPLGVDAATPRFSWQVLSSLTNVLQTSYRIIVADAPEKLSLGKDLMWNSGEVKSGISILIQYKGKALQQGKRYYWKVKIWTNKGQTSWSEVAQWSTSFGAQAFSKAMWIGLDSVASSGKLTTKTRLSARYLRKEITVASKIRQSLLYICGLGLYECYVNGQKINNDFLAPTATDYSKRVCYNVIDVSRFLRDGRNTIGVVLGNGRFFSMRMENIPGGEPLDVPPIHHYGFPKLLLQLEIEYADGRKKTVVSDSSWKISTKGPIVANNEFDGEEYEARLEMPGWSSNGFNDRFWQNAKLVDAPLGQLMAQSNPNIAIMREVKPVSVKEIPTGGYVVDMGQNMVGWLAVKLKGISGRPITFRYAETLQKNGTLYTANLRGARSTDIYTPARGDVFWWEPRFVYHGFRFVEITGVDYPPHLGDLIGKVVYDAMANTGTFETSNRTINEVYHNALWGIMGNYRSMPTDCPQRDERMGWLGDRATGCYGESFIFDNGSLYSKWAQDIHDTQKESGSLSDVAPAYWAFYTDNITWSAAYIHVANMLYEQFGDERPIRQHYQSMKKWLSYMQARYMKDYIITKDQYGDWCVPPEDLSIIFSKDSARMTDGEILSTSFFYKILNIMAKYAVITGNEIDQRAFLSMAEKVKAAYNNKFFQKQTAQYGNNTVTANIVSLMLGLVPSGYEQKVFNNLANRIECDFKSHVSVGLIGIQFLMRGLTAYGRPDLAYQIATNRTYPSWGYMIDHGATTIWELWNGDTADPAMNSGNHVMLLGDLLTWYYESLAGIQTDRREVGFKKIILKPIFLDDLKFVKASHVSPYGKIESEWRSNGDDISWRVVIPANTTAEVHLQLSSVCMVYKNGKLLSHLTNVKGVNSEPSELTIHVGSGGYDFKISKVPHDNPRNYQKRGN